MGSASTAQAVFDLMSGREEGPDEKMFDLVGDQLRDLAEKTQVIEARVDDSSTTALAVLDLVQRIAARPGSDVLNLLETLDARSMTIEAEVKESTARSRSGTPRSPRRRTPLDRDEDGRDRVTS